MTGRTLLSPRDFGATFDPPKSSKRIKDLCRAGRIPGAQKPSKEWIVPEGSKILGAGQRFEYPANPGISVVEFARMHGRSTPRVYQLLKQGRIEGARKTQYGWGIDPDAPWPADDGF